MNDTNEQARAAVRVALTKAGRRIPSLAGLAASVQPSLALNVASAAIDPAGNLLVNPDWFLMLDGDAQMFLMAHELLHLQRRTHDRQPAGEHAATFNLAHDAVINQFLAARLGMKIAASGISYPWAADLSAEEVFRRLLANPPRRRPAPHWRGTLMGPPRVYRPDAVPSAVGAIGDRTSAPGARGAPITRTDGPRSDDGTRSCVHGSFTPAPSPLPSAWHGSVRDEADRDGGRVTTWSRRPRRQTDPRVLAPGLTRRRRSLVVALDTSTSMADQIQLAVNAVAAYVRSGAVDLVHRNRCTSPVLS